MSKIISYIFLFIALPIYAANPSATSIVEKVVETIRSAPSITTRLEVTSHGETNKGSMTLSGDRFAFSSPQMSTWYDGNTLWSYSSATNEINISEPTQEELQEINPFTYIKAARTAYTPLLIASDASAYTIQLTPKKKNEIEKIDIKVSKATNLPTYIKLFHKKGSIVITLSATKIGKQLLNSTFQFNRELFPDAEIVDLR